jgi:hypothetical protein
VQVSVCVRIETSSTRFEDLEIAAVEAARKAAKEALEQACRRLETARGRRACRGRGRRRTLLTRVGYLTIARGRSRRADGTRYFPLDERLGLPAHHEASPWVRSRALHLAATHPYREAARLLSQEVGAVVDHRAVWRWVQAEGARRRSVKDKGVRAMFCDGEAPPRPKEAPPEALTVGIDATGIRLKDGTTASVKLAVAFTSSERVRKTKKRSLHRRHVFAALEDTDRFGMALAHELERVYGAHLIPRLMVLGDGEPWIEGLTRSWLPTATYQCDWWHLGAKVRELCRDDLKRWPRLRRRAFRRPDRLARDLLAGRGIGDPKEARLLGQYLARNGSHLYTFARMGPGRWLKGSGPAEKHIELTINRRFKRRGMSWSRQGAANLLALRLEVIATS